MNDARRCIWGLPRCTGLNLLHEAFPMLSPEEMERNQERMCGEKLAHTLPVLMPPWSTLLAQTTMSPTPDPIPPWQKTTVTPATPITMRTSSTTNAGKRRRFSRWHEQSGGGGDKLRLYDDEAFEDGVAASVTWHYGNETKSKALQPCGSVQEAEARAVLEAIEDITASSSEGFQENTRLHRLAGRHEGAHDASQGTRHSQIDFF